MRMLEAPDRRSSMRRYPHVPTFSLTALLLSMGG